MVVGWGLTCTHAFATCCVSVCAPQTPLLRTLGVRLHLHERKDFMILSLCDFGFSEKGKFYCLYFYVNLLLQCGHDNM